MAGVAVLTLTVAGACDPAAKGQPLLTDPAEIVMAAVRSTAGLKGVHAKVEVAFKGGGQAFGGPDMQTRTTLDLDLDMATRNYSGRSVTDSAGIDQASEVISVDGNEFTRNPPNARWTQFSDFGGGPSFPTNEMLVAAIGAVIDGGGAGLTLADSEPCGEMTCYHVIAELNRAATWQLIAPLAMGGTANEAPPPDFPVPALAIDMLVDQATRALLVAKTTVVTQGISIDLAVTLSNHDVEVVIAPPPPGMVDQMNNGFGGGGVITNVGGEVAPAPEPASAESPQPLP
jgi:hypothetical protein